MGQLLRRILYLARRRRMDRELAADLEAHREMAALAGNHNLGNALHYREEAREAWGWTWIDRLGQDLRYACRMLRRSPGFTVAAVLMLAVGLGVTVAAFSFFDLIVLRPLNVREPDTLLRFHRRSPQAYAFSVPYPQMDFLRRHTTTLAAVLALNTTKVSIEGEPKAVEAHFVSANFFQELGAVARIGRPLDAARDDAPAADPAIVLAHGFWLRHFGGDPSVAGRTVHVNGKAATIVGVAPPEFTGLSMGVPAFWAPIEKQPVIATGSKLLTDFSVERPGVQMFGRLRPGLTPKAAEAELAALTAELRNEHPRDIWEQEALVSEPGGYATSLMSTGRRGTGAESRGELASIFGLIGALVLLILSVACANLGSLLLARGSAREREISIRVSVGAGSGRLVRQLFTESIVLALLGAAAGLVTGYFVLRALMTVSGAPAWLDPTPDWRVVLFTVGLAFLAAVLFGLAPALQIARGRRRARARQFLVGAQVAASCVLLIVAGLLTRALDRAASADVGFEFRRVIAVDPGLAEHGYSPAASRAWFDTFTARMRSLGGVESVSVTLSTPLGRRSMTAGITEDGRSIDAQVHRVDPEFFETMRIPLLRGRALSRGEADTVVVGEAAARGLWPGQDPIGKALHFDRDYTVVGVTRAARLIKLESSDLAEIYLPLTPGDLSSAAVLVRTAGPPEDMARQVSTTARSLATDLFPEVQLLKEGHRRKLENAQVSALAVSVLGGVAHLLACLGIVGVVSYAVSRSTREIGIRMALGAQPSDVLSVVLRQFSWPVAAGLVIGVAGAAALSQLLRGQLYGVSHHDPLTFGVVIALFVATAVLAAVVPARRALKIDPLRALRHD